MAEIGRKKRKLFFVCLVGEFLRIRSHGDSSPWKETHHLGGIFWCYFYNHQTFANLMVNWWFGLVFWDSNRVPLSKSKKVALMFYQNNLSRDGFSLSKSFLFPNRAEENFHSILAGEKQAGC